jgi:hypothetical protein
VAALSISRPLRVRYLRVLPPVYLPDKNVDGVRAFDQPSEFLVPSLPGAPLHAPVARRRILSALPGHAGPDAGVRGSGPGPPRQRGGATEIAPIPGTHQLDRRTRCPQCGRDIDTHYYAGGGNVVIDDCSHCELNWLNAWN